MQIIEKNIKELIPYEKNPRKNDKSVDKVAQSIDQFGFRVPVVIDKDNVIVCGHTRYKAAKKLHLTSVPCVVADDLTDEQIKASSDRSKIDSYMNSLRQRSKENAKKKSNVSLAQQLQRAQAEGRMEITINGKRYYRKSKRGSNWYA